MDSHNLQNDGIRLSSTWSDDDHFSIEKYMHTDKA